MFEWRRKPKNTEIYTSSDDESRDKLNKSNGTNGGSGI